MTPKRIAALQWLYDVHHIGIEPERAVGEQPSRRMHDLLARDWMIDGHGRLTHLGLRALHEATRP